MADHQTHLTMVVEAVAEEEDRRPVRAAPRVRAAVYRLPDLRVDRATLAMILQIRAMARTKKTMRFLRPRRRKYLFIAEAPKR